MDQWVLRVLTGLTIVGVLISGCVAVPDTTEPTFSLSSDPVPTPSLTPIPAPHGFDAEHFLFIEVQEMRVRKSDVGEQTTSFAGEYSTYGFDPDAGTVSGTLEGTLAGNTPVVVGHVVATQIDRNTVASGQLYVLPESGRQFGPIEIERPESDGTLLFTYAGDLYLLEPGESVQFDVEVESSDEGLSADQPQHRVTITNHGFLHRDNIAFVTL